MNILKELLSFEHNFVKLLEKYEKFPNEDLSSLVEDYLEKEQQLFRSISKKELADFFDFFAQKYFVSFESNFIEQIYWQKDYPCEVIRIFSFLYFKQLIQIVQSNSHLSFEEMKQLEFFPPVQQMLDEYEFLKSFFKKSYFILKNAGISLPSYAVLFLLNQEDLLELNPNYPKKTFSKQIASLCYPFLNGFYMTTLESLLQLEDENDANFLLLNTYFEALPEDYQFQIKVMSSALLEQYPFLTNPFFLKKLSILFDSHQIPFHSLFEDDKQENGVFLEDYEKYLDEPMEQDFTFEDFCEYPTVLLNLKQVSMELFQKYLTIISKILSKDTTEIKKLTFSFQNTYHKELTLIDEIPMKERFLSFIITFYPENNVTLPMEVLEFLKGFSIEDLESLKKMDQIIFIHLIELLKDKIISKEKSKKENQKNTILIDLGKLEMSYTLAKLNALYLTHQISEEDYIQKMNSYSLLDDSSEEYVQSCFQIVYANFLYFLKQSLPSSNQDLYHLCYLLVFLDKQLLEFAIKENFELPSVYKTIGYDSLGYQAWKETSFPLILQYAKVKSNDDLMKITLNAYCEAIMSTYVAEDKEKIKKSLKQKPKKNHPSE